MNRDNRDFAGHPTRRHWLTPMSCIWAAIFVSLLVTAIWAESQIAATTFAEREAARQMGSTRP